MNALTSSADRLIQSCILMKLKKKLFQNGGDKMKYYSTHHKQEHKEHIAFWDVVGVLGLIAFVAFLFFLPEIWRALL